MTMTEVSVEQFGGRIQAALDSGAAVVRIPPGDYLTGPLRIGSNTRLIAAPAARIRFVRGAGRDSHCFLLSNRDPVGGDVNIQIEGGIWDGNAPGNPRGPDEPGSYTGALLNFRNVRGLTVRDATLHDATAYYVRLTATREFVFERLRFTAEHLRLNQDGIHVAGDCEDGVIRELTATGVGVTHDDLVALVADDALNRAQNLDLKCGPIRRVRVEHLRADDCHSFVRLASVWHPIEDVTVRDVRGGCRVCAVNADALRYCRVPLFDARDPRYAAGVGALENVRLEDFVVHKTEANDKPLFLLETRMRQFVLRRARRERARDVAPATPLVRVRHVSTDSLVVAGRPPVALPGGEEFVFDDTELPELVVADCRRESVHPEQK